MCAIYATEDSTSCQKACLNEHSPLHLELREAGTEAALLCSNGKYFGFKQGNRFRKVTPSSGSAPWKKGGIAGFECAGPRPAL